MVYFVLGMVSGHIILLSKKGWFAKVETHLFKIKITEIDIQKNLECKSKNATYQKKLINLIDDIIDKELDIKNPIHIRYFSKKMKEEKLKEQNGLCALCKTSLSLENSEADHIKKWTLMGLTTSENCQVLHKRCHKEKES